MSLLEAPSLIEAPPNGSANCHKIVAPPKKKRKKKKKKEEAPGASYKNLMESMNKYIVQALHMLLKIVMAATTACLLVRACKNYHLSAIHYKRSLWPTNARNGRALGSVLAPGASNREITVYSLYSITSWWKS